MLRNHTRRSILALALAFALPLAHAQSVGSAFTYQGELRASGTAANAAYDFQFRLYNAASGGTQLGTQVPANAVTVTNGLFSVPLDFGPAQFAGDAQWLEISVRPAGSGTFETLSPRTAVTATPYALGAVAALANSVTTTSIVDGAVQFSDVNAGQLQARVTGTCAGSQGIQSIGANGTVVCGTFSGGSGTITGVTAGTGLTGGGTSGAVTLAIAAGSVGSALINVDQVQRRVSGTCPASQYVRVVNQDGTVVCGTDAIGAAGWGLTGNAGTNPVADFLGTTDSQPFVIRTRNTRSLRIEPSAETAVLFGAITANIIAGSAANFVAAGVRGATMSGGGVAPDNPLVRTDPDFTPVSGNAVTDHYGTVGGGVSNRAGDGQGDLVSSPFSTVGGGYSNTAGGRYSTVAGGERNAATGAHSTVAGGLANSAAGLWSAVGGGDQNCAGGTFSWAGGRFAKVRPGSFSGPPGQGCTGVPAAGDGDGDRGTFVWSDAQDGAFQSSGDNQFLIRAVGGVAINTNAPASGRSLTVAGSTSLGGNVDVATSGSLSFGSQTRQMLNLWGPNQYGIGVQSDTLYFRTDSAAGNFAWFAGGSHNDAALNPGSGGNLAAVLNASGSFQLFAPQAEPLLSLGYASNPAGGVAAWSLSGLRNPLSGLGAGSFLLATNAAARFGVQPDGVTRNATGVWATFSDARLKKNIHAIESPLDTYLKLRGHWFEYIDPKSVMADEGERMGFVAQEVRDAVPQWVREGEDGILSVVPTGFEALTVEAVRQLHEENAVVDDEQLRRIEWLETENSALRNRSASLEELTRQLLDRVSALEAGSAAPR